MVPGGPITVLEEEASAHAAALADSMGPVCFGPRQNRLRP